MSRCSKCGTDEADGNVKACRRCGTKLLPNQCTNPDCEKHSHQDLPDNADFCPLCGMETSYVLHDMIDHKLR